MKLSVPVSIEEDDSALALYALLSSVSVNIGETGDNASVSLTMDGNLTGDNTSLSLTIDGNLAKSEVLDILKHGERVISQLAHAGLQAKYAAKRSKASKLLIPEDFEEAVNALYDERKEALDNAGSSEQEKDKADPIPKSAREMLYQIHEEAGSPFNIPDVNCVDDLFGNERFVKFVLYVLLSEQKELTDLVDDMKLSVEGFV